MRFDGFLGNDALKNRLDAAFFAGRISHCYLLCGPVGSGKHTLARLMAAAMECESADAPCGVCKSCRKIFQDVHPDVITVDDTEHVFVRIDVVRAARSDVFERPNEAKKKIYVFPRGDALGVPAQNALLKILEEPPEYAVFLILTANEEALLPTIRSRCVSLHLAPLSFDEAKDALQEKFPERSEDALRAAHSRAGGFLGQTMQLLSETEPDAAIVSFAQSYAANDRLAILSILAGLEKQKRQVAANLLWQWHALLVHALEAKSGCSTDAPHVREIARTHTGMQLMQAAQATAKAADALSQNASVGTVVGWLCSRL